MLIYFAASTYQTDLKQEDRQNYLNIVNALEKLGHKVISEYELGSTAQAPRPLTSEERRTAYRKFLQGLNKCEMLVVEVSYPSTLHVGHEISMALEKNKPVLALYTKDNEPPFLAGNLSDKLLYEEYTPENLSKVLERALTFTEQHCDARFNFFISPKHIGFLNFISRKRKIPKSVYLRELIEQDKQKNPEYVGE